MVTKACNVATTVKNTGVDCQLLMLAIAQLWAVPTLFRMNLTDIADEDDMLEFFKTKMHAARGERIYPFFGRKAPIRYITNEKEADVLITHDDGSKQLVRYGFLNQSYGTTSGGLCYAQALQAWNESGYDILKVDIDGKMLVAGATDGINDYQGMITDFMFSPSPDEADLKNVWKTWFQLSHNPKTYINSGIILAGLSNLLALNGLIDAEISAFTAATIGLIKISATAHCSEENLATSLGATFNANKDNFSVVDKATSVAVALSGAALVGSHIELAGTFVTGHTYIVSVVSPADLFDNDVEGYDFDDAGAIEVLIP